MGCNVCNTYVVTKSKISPQQKHRSSGNFNMHIKLVVITKTNFIKIRAVKYGSPPPPQGLSPTDTFVPSEIVFCALRVHFPVICFIGSEIARFVSSILHFVVV